MVVIGNTFSVILFLSMIGGIFTVLTFSVKKVFDISVPLWFSVCGAFMYVFPIIMPSLRLLPPEIPEWLYGYKVACFIWLLGLSVFAVYFTVRNILAYRALLTYRFCENERINNIFINCKKNIGLKRNPKLYFGTLNTPACILFSFKPAVILNEEIINQLSDEELEIILSHELMHIKRKHHIIKIFFDIISIVHWFNPLVWVAKNDYAIVCELDCDKKTLSVMNGKTTEIIYAKTMFHLLELFKANRRWQNRRIEALGFLNTKQRIKNILNQQDITQIRFLRRAILFILVVSVIAISIYISRSYFYPYPAFINTTEYIEIK